jgi:hypothetical protein
VILEGALDDLMKEIWSNYFMNTRTREVEGEQLYIISLQLKPEPELHTSEQSP